MPSGAKMRSRVNTSNGLPLSFSPQPLSRAHCAKVTEVGTLYTPAEVRAIADDVQNESDRRTLLEVAEEYERLLASLGEEKLRLIAVLKMEGYTAGATLRHFGKRKQRRCNQDWILIDLRKQVRSNNRGEHAS